MPARRFPFTSALSPTCSCPLYFIRAYLKALRNKLKKIFIFFGNCFLCIINYITIYVLVTSHLYINYRESAPRLVQGLIALRALVIIYIQQAGPLPVPRSGCRSCCCYKPIPVPRPAASRCRSSVTHGIGTVADIPDQPYDLYIYIQMQLSDKPVPYSEYWMRSLPLNIADSSSVARLYELECEPMPNVMVALPNIGDALYSTPQSLAGAHY